MLSCGDRRGRFAAGGWLESTHDGLKYPPKSIATADVDSDGDVDVIASEDLILVWANDGAGEFEEPVAHTMQGGNHGLC